LLLLGLLFGLILARLPATWLDHALQRVSHGSLALADARGTVWGGDGQLQAILPSGEVANLEHVVWRVDRTALFHAGLRVVTQRRADGQVVMDATASLSGLSIPSLALDIPAGLLGAYSRTLADLGLSGTMRLSARDARWQSGQASGTGAIQWTNAASALSSIRPLGNYLVDLVGKGDHLEYLLLSRNAQLQLNGKGTWRFGAAPEFTGEAIPAEAHRDDLAPLLRMIGKDGGNGRYALVLNATTGLGVR
jgi:general secretion pathway protein N